VDQVARSTPEFSIRALPANADFHLIRMTSDGRLVRCVLIVVYRNIIAQSFAGAKIIEGSAWLHNARGAEKMALLAHLVAQFRFELHGISDRSTWGRHMGSSRPVAPFTSNGNFSKRIRCVKPFSLRIPSFRPPGMTEKTIGGDSSRKPDRNRGVVSG